MERKGQKPGGATGARWAVDGAFAGAILIVLLARFLILSEGGAPATIDGGNWLAFGDSMFGAEVRSPSIVYPPLVPLLTTAFVWAFGFVGGIAVLGALASVAPAIGFYVSVRPLGLGMLTLPGSLLLLGAGAVGEAAAWGGFPQLIGLGLTPLILFEVDRWCTRASRFTALKIGILLMAVLATTHFIAVAIVGAGAVVFAMGLPRVRRQSRSEESWAIDGLAVVLPSMWLVPLYGDLVGAFSGSAGDFRFLNQLEWSNVLERIEFIYRDFPALWRVALPLTILTPLLLARHWKTPMWRVLTAVIVSSAGLAFVSREGRFLYFISLAVALAATLWLDRATASIDARSSAAPGLEERGKATKRVLVILAVGLATWQVFAGIRLFQEQRDYYGILTPGLYSTLESIRDDTPHDSVVAVTSIGDAPLGWWVEAISGRQTYYGSALRWLAFEDEHRRARIANSIFTRTFPDAASTDTALEHDIDYLIIPTRWGFFTTERLEPAAEAGGVARLSNRDVVVLRSGDLADR